MTAAPPANGAAAADDAVAIAADVLAGRRSAAEVLAAHVARHRAVRELNALVQPRLGEAAAEAAAFDAGATGSRSAATAPLAGVPVSVKECFPIRGMRTTLGIPWRRDVLDADDAWLVTRLREAGAIVVGKANVPQAMYMHETVNPVWGRTDHPLDQRRNPGGSSGGDAALVASGVVPLAVGNDLAGSLRQPAHACGIAAIVPRTTALGDGGAFDTLPGLRVVRPRAGFLARSVGDLALACAAAGVAATPRPADAPRLRVGWWDAAGPIPASPVILRAVREAVAALDRNGVDVVRLDGRVADEAAWLHLALLAADGGTDVRALFGPDRPMRGVRRLLAFARLPRRWRPAVATLARLAGSRIEAEGVRRTGPRDVAAFADLVVARDELATRFAAEVAGCDCVVCPVAAVPAMRHGAAARLILATAPCLPANLFDLAAGAVPVTCVRGDEERGRRWSPDPVLRAAVATDRGSRGLPVGVQVVGCPGRDEATVLDVMRLIEGARG